MFYSSFPEIKVAAIQLQPVIGDVSANLSPCEKLADEAAAKGAQWIILPEFYNGHGLRRTNRKCGIAS
ncbi:nitrilase-related carbon-nitrogen hydrolase [Effusibacillus dendaii]|uniref:CN hydrolase domain-containing protein n=1 Tax=Effusibacillus dendaii TaxID=2743772 RepID=A0A7I8DER1_9BACL|nr:nitrilase-related carbon-nitrogen hydrolase [Effusibacillus dendaii]BCJ87040.1 hypothetical protein skT53_20250 [Effusibacillus dendaii]